MSERRPRVISAKGLEAIRAGALQRSINICAAKAVEKCTKQAQHRADVRAGRADKRAPSNFALYIKANYQRIKGDMIRETGHERPTAADAGRWVATGVGEKKGYTMAYSKTNKKTGAVSYYWNVMGRAGAEWNTKR